MGFDLHMHSTASDGQCSPKELVRRAAALGLEAMAVSDHDTVAGVQDAMAWGHKLGVPVIPAMELSASFHGELHILGYAMDIRHDALTQFLRDQIQTRADRNHRMLQALAHLGMTVTQDDIRALTPGAGDGWGRGHVALLLAEKGYCKTPQEAFDRWLDYGKPAYVQREKTTATQCLDLIHSCGGYAALAHPGQIGLDEQALRALIGGLRDQGLDALESYHPSHQPGQARQYARMARDMGLMNSYGSDFHRDGSHHPPMMAKWEDFKPQEHTRAWLDRLIPAARSRYAQLFGQE